MWCVCGPAVHQGLPVLWRLSDSWSHLFSVTAGRLYLNMVMIWAEGIHGMPVDTCSAAIRVYIGKHAWRRRVVQSDVVERQHSEKTSSYLKLSQNNAIVCSAGFTYRDRRLAAEGVAESGDVLCLCQSEQQTVNTVTCQTFTPWTTNGTFSH